MKKEKRRQEQVKHIRWAIETRRDDPNHARDYLSAIVSWNPIIGGK
jgi:hypothetical protein